MTQQTYALIGNSSSVQETRPFFSLFFCRLLGFCAQNAYAPLDILNDTNRNRNCWCYYSQGTKFVNGQYTPFGLAYSNGDIITAVLSYPEGPPLYFLSFLVCVL
jgi:hypothetical protein